MSQRPSFLSWLRRPTGRWLACGPVALLTLVSLGAARPLPAQVSVSGRVVDAELGEPLPSVSVELLTGTGTAAYSAVTGEQGTFRITGVRSGTYTLLVTALGFEPHRVDRVGVGDENVTLGTIELISRAFKLNPIVVTASRDREKALEAPAAVHTVTAEEVQEEPATVPAEHVVGLPGVDNVTYGVQQHNVVARGFNNVFSGSLFVLQDNRWASVPSLRFNAYNLIPSTDEDIQRIEVVLGPGSALYGPNVDQGVMHIITRSPLDYQGSSISVLGAARDGNNEDSSNEGIFQGVFRTSNLISENVGYKLSGMYLEGEDWHYIDPAEQQARQEAIAAGANPDTLKIGNRDFTAERWAVDARTDFRVGDNSTFVLAGGATRMGRSLEMTGIGTAQAVDWTYWYAQGRAQLGQLFAQAYINMSDAGESFLLREGTPLDDNSFLFAGQVQHSSELGAANRFIYGVDLIRTVPRTNQSIHGRNEDDDDITEVGGYVQWEGDLAPKWDLVAAARLDWHSVVDDLVFSPRAGVVFKPTPEHNFRLTYNRAFSQPTSINLSLDLQSSPTLGPFTAYGVRALGVPSETGLTFRRDCGGGLCIRSPFDPDPTAFRDLDVTPYWDAAVASLNPLLRAVGEDTLPSALIGLLTTVDPSSTQVGTVVRRFSQETLSFGDPISDLSVAAVDVPPLVPSITNTVEFGYKGLLGERLLIGGDIYFQKIEDFIGPLRFETPNAMFDPADLNAFLAPILQGAGLSPQQAAGVVFAMGQIPLATATWEQAPTGNPTDLFLTYRNFGDVEIWGADLGLTLLLSDRWSLQGSYSWVSDDLFEGLGNEQVDSIGDIALNAPKNKGSLGVRYENSRIGLGVGLKGRYVQGYPVQSGVFEGSIPGFFLLNGNITYHLPTFTRTEIALDFRNFFACVGQSTTTPSIDDGCGFGKLHQEIVGAPFIGSMISLRVRQPF